MDGAVVVSLIPLSLIAFAISFSCSATVVKLRNRIAMHAATDKRRHHVRRVPQLGGIGIILGVLASYSYFMTNVQGASFSVSPLYFSLAMLATLAFGLADDKYELRARWKLLGQFLVTGALLYGMKDHETPFDRAFGHQGVLSTSIEAFWCLGALNSINFIDGMDGLASGVGILVIGFLCATSFQDPHVVPLLWTAIPAIAGFYLWNRSSARIFLGESGSQAIGALVFIAAMTYSGANLNSGNIIAPFFAMGVPIFDTIMAIARRLSRGVGVMAPDREHIHHRLLRLGLSHKNVVRFLHLITVYLCLIGYQFTILDRFYFSTFTLVMTGLGINLLLLLMAEKKLYSYLTSFASHLLKLVDQSREEKLAYIFRARSSNKSSAAHVYFQLNLENSVKSLLEQNPSRIRPFYDLLKNSLCPDGSLRELHFASSTEAYVIEPHPPGANVDLAEERLLKDLEKIEREHKLDLYLNLRATLKRLSPAVFPTEGVKAA